MINPQIYQISQGDFDPLDNTTYHNFFENGYYKTSYRSMGFVQN